MRDKLLKLVEQKIHEAQDDYAVDKKHMPSQGIRSRELTDAILALEVEGQTAPDKCGHPKGQKCRNWGDGKLTHGCIHNSHGDVDHCLQVNKRTATIADILEVK